MSETPHDYMDRVGNTGCDLPADTGLWIDTIDVDRLRKMAMSLSYTDFTGCDDLRDVADRLEEAIRDIGLLRQAAGLGGQDE